MKIRVNAAEFNQAVKNASLFAAKNACVCGGEAAEAVHCLLTDLSTFTVYSCDGNGYYEGGAFVTLIEGDRGGMACSIPFAAIADVEKFTRVKAGVVEIDFLPEEIKFTIEKSSMSIDKAAYELPDYKGLFIDAVNAAKQKPVNNFYGYQVAPFDLARISKVFGAKEKSRGLVMFVCQREDSYFVAFETDKDRVICVADFNLPRVKPVTSADIPDDPIE